MLSLLRLERQRKDFFIKSISNLHFSCFYLNRLIHLELKRRIGSYTPPNFGPKGANFQTKWRKNHTLWGGTYLYDKEQTAKTVDEEPAGCQLWIKRERDR